MSEQRWLYLTEICNLLLTTPAHIKWLTKHNYLEMLPGTHNEGFTGCRFLDPTPEYAERLRTNELIYGKRRPMPIDMDLPSKAIFTAMEVSVILGVDSDYTKNYLHKHKVPCLKVGKGNGIHLYSALAIRQLLWKRERRTRRTSKQKSLFLLSELIAWFREYKTTEDALMPTDQQFEEDDRFQKKLKRLLQLPSPQKEAAMRELLDKVELAKTVVQNLD
jgi:hypothetical protein